MSENIPDFNFSFAHANNARKEIESTHEKITERINNICESEKFFINGFPVLKNIIALRPERDDLKRVAKALDRLADLVDGFQQIDKKLSVLNIIQEDPHWLAWTFGDFSKEVEEDLEKFFENQE